MKTEDEQAAAAGELVGLLGGEGPLKFIEDLIEHVEADVGVLSGGDLKSPKLTGKDETIAALRELHAVVSEIKSEAAQLRMLVKRLRSQHADWKVAAGVVRVVNDVPSQYPSGCTALIDYERPVNLAVGQGVEVRALLPALARARIAALITAPVLADEVEDGKAALAAVAAVEEDHLVAVALDAHGRTE